MSNERFLFQIFKNFLVLNPFLRGSGSVQHCPMEGMRRMSRLPYLLEVNKIT